MSSKKSRKTRNEPQQFLLSRHSLNAVHSVKSVEVNPSKRHQLIMDFSLPFPVIVLAKQLSILLDLSTTRTCTLACWL